MFKISSFFLFMSIFLFANEAKEKVFLQLEPHSNKFIFSKEERLYLESKKQITACIDPNWMPFESFRGNEHIGLSSDYLKLFEKNLGISIDVIKTDTWSQTLEFAKKRVCDIIPLISKNKDREKYLNFTSPLIKTPIVIATKLNKIFVIDFKSISDKKIGIPKDYAIAKRLKQKYPYLNIIDVVTIKEGMEKVKKGELYGVIGSLAVVGYMLQREYLGELKINGKFEETLELSMGIRDDEKILADIFQKLINNISQNQYNNIFDRWVSTPIQDKTDYIMLFKIITFLIFILIAMLFFTLKQNKLKRKIDYQNIFLEKRVERATTEISKQNIDLTESVNNFQDIFDGTMEMIVFYDTNRKITNVNISCIKLLGYQYKSEIIGKDIMSFLPKDEYGLAKEKMAQEFAEPYELKLLKKDDSEIYTLTSAKYITYSGIKMRMLSIVDITELKQKEKQLLQQSKLAQMGDMVSMIAHQWRQPLNAISASSINLSLLSSMQMLEDAKVQEDSEFIQNQCQKMSETINTFMNFVKPSKDSKEFVLLHSIEAILSLMGTQLANHNIDVILESKEKNLSIVGYEDLLEQVIINILSNAKDAFEELKKEDKFIKITIDFIDKIPMIIIEDNAGGIPPEIAEKIFNPYFTTKEQGKGTGLGLYMSKDIMKKSFGGDLQYSATDDGSCFKIICK